MENPLSSLISSKLANPCLKGRYVLDVCNATEIVRQPLFLIYIGVSEVNTVVIMPQQSVAARRERVTSVCAAVAELLMVEQH